MHTRKGRGLPNLAALREAPMGSSRPPRWRAWLVRMVERFGFVLVCVLTLITLAVFFIGPDLIRQNAEGILGRTDEQEHGLFADGQSGSAGQPGLAGADVSLAITTNPVGAAIYIDGDYAGVSPLRGLVVEQGRRLITVHKPDYAQFDTFLTFNEPSTALSFSLRDGVVVRAASREDTPPAPRKVPPSPPKPAKKKAAPAETAPVPQKQTPPPAVAERWTCASCAKS